MTAQENNTNAVPGPASASAMSSVSSDDVSASSDGVSASSDDTGVASEALSNVQAQDAPVDAGSAEDSETKKWYVVQAYSGYEAKVRLALEERIRQAGMEEVFSEILIPQENVQENRNGKKRVSTRNFYPGYIFVHMDMNDRSWHLVKETPKVSGFVGGRYPTPVSRSEIRAIADQVAEGAAKPKPKVAYAAGDYVRVTNGAFANFAGTVEEVKPEKQKVRVLVSIFGRSTPVELSYSEVEKAV